MYINILTETNEVTYRIIAFVTMNVLGMQENDVCCNCIKKHTVVRYNEQGCWP